MNQSTGVTEEGLEKRMRLNSPESELKCESELESKENGDAQEV